MKKIFFTHITTKLNKSIFSSLFVAGISLISAELFAQNTVVTPNGQKITVNAAATTSTAGIVQLAGDLGGTSAAPTIVNNAITTAKILDANVTTAKVADAAITTIKILDANVTSAKVADGAITTTKILDAAITTAKIAKGSTALQILRTNAANTGVEWATATTVTATEQTFTATAGQTSFTLTNTPLNSSLGSVTFYINGTKIPNAAISLAGAVVTYAPASNGTYALMAGDVITFTYLY